MALSPPALPRAPLTPAMWSRITAQQQTRIAPNSSAPRLPSNSDPRSADFPHPYPSHTGGDGPKSPQNHPRVTHLEELTQTAPPVSPAEGTPGRSSRHTLKPAIPRRACVAATTRTAEKRSKGQLRSLRDLSASVEYRTQHRVKREATPRLTRQGACVSLKHLPQTRQV